MNSERRRKRIEEQQWNGFYRAKVTGVDIDDNDYGAIRVFIPDMMTELDNDYDEETMGLKAYPANSPLGGYNDDNEESYFQSTVYVPLKGSYVWVFFESGNVNRPFYFSGFNYKQAKLPPENRDGEEPHKVYTIIKTHSGRSIIVSDSEDIQRIEITGKKREMEDGPSGDENSIYQIDDNQTTVLLDERDGREKLLIRSRKGDYINFDIENRNVNIKCQNNIEIKSGGSINLQSDEDINLKAVGSINQQTINGEFNILSGNSLYLTSEIQTHIRALDVVSLDGSYIFSGSGLSISASSTIDASPVGERD
ncbi:MAG: hypothetical protein ACOCQD_00995 [archaeon]